MLHTYLPLLTHVKRMCTQGSGFNRIHVYCFVKGILKWNEWFFTESPWRWTRDHHALWYHCLDAKALAGLPTNITPNSMQIMFQCHCKYTFDFGPPEKVFRSFKGSMSRLQNENKKTHKKPLPYMDHGLSSDSGWNQLSPKHEFCWGAVDIWSKWKS